MIRASLYKPESGEIQPGDESLLPAWQANPQSVIWVDLSAVDKTEERKLLRQYFTIDDLALDDCQRERHPPKLEWFDNYFFLLLKGFTAETNSIDYGIVHISFFVSERFLVTRHDGVSASINLVWEHLHDNPGEFQYDPRHLCYRIVRTIIDRYTPVVLNMEETMDNLEEQMLAKPNDVLLGELITYNSQLKKMRRNFSYQATIFAELARTKSVFFNDINRHEFNDAYEQMERLTSLSGLLQELTMDLINGYISVSSHRLNTIIRVLTIATVIVLPLTLLAGIYGMNFENMPELHSRNGYYILLGIMTGIAVTLLGLFRLLKWL